MTRTIQDSNFLEWEVFASAGRFGYTDNAHVVFNCTTLRNERPRCVVLTDLDEADAERAVMHASDDDLRRMLERSSQIP